MDSKPSTIARSAGHTGATSLATDGTVRTGSPLDEHQFCPTCGYCIECEDCAIWGCGRKEED